LRGGARFFREREFPATTRLGYHRTMRVSDLDLIFVPASADNSPDYWQTRWRDKLSTARGVATIGGAPSSAHVVEAARLAPQPILFIGHSLGALAIAEAAAELTGADVRGAFLVAPPDEDALPGLAGGNTLSIPRSRLPWPSVMVASRTDPLALFARSRALAEDWGSEFVDAGDSGRIDADSGHGPWPDGLLRLARFLKGL
jgi:predicted alpha/beta hydrolase family esterase